MWLPVVLVFKMQPNDELQHERSSSAEQLRSPEEENDVEKGASSLDAATALEASASNVSDDDKGHDEGPSNQRLLVSQDKCACMDHIMSVMLHKLTASS